jgi:hypothetical protein
MQPGVFSTLDRKVYIRDTGPDAFSLEPDSGGLVPVPAVRYGMEQLQFRPLCFVQGRYFKDRFLLVVFRRAGSFPSRLSHSISSIKSCRAFEQYGASGVASRLQ